MSEYAFRQLLKELEWQSRAALAVADDLEDLLATCDGERITPVLQALIVRAQKVVELLWPGHFRLADRLYAGASGELRDQVEVGPGSALTQEMLAPLYHLLEHPLDREQSPDLCRRLVVRRGDEDYPLRPLLAALRDTWARSAALLTED